MTVKELKKQIEDKTVLRTLRIFKYADNSFLAKQYCTAIADVWNEPIVAIDSVDGVIADLNDIFGVHTFNGALQVLTTDEFECNESQLSDCNNVIIVCKKLGKHAVDLFSEYVIEFPKLEDWQIKDYVYSLADGVEPASLDWLIAICKNDIYRLQAELDKLTIFSATERKIVFNDFLADNAFSDLSQHTIFNFTNALITKDVKQLAQIYTELDNIDSNEMGVVAILYQGFKNIINIQLSNNPTAESCGLKPNQFYAIKHNINRYNKEQLIKIFGLLTDIDRQIKTGQMPVELLLDYLITHILSI